ncbi:uncharacterized protein LOC119672827 [Teleopsis dalmanni]|uniref:uncharacterized protein LOC119672827 n=1 Tax=Teleopsis dalmanni TaxID=139649 RepID=UPI0018CD522D|nr:uncharacterized protein LOC119672827 [Teleopsis dalmanni]
MMYKILFLSYLLCHGFIGLQAMDPACFKLTWYRDLKDKSKNTCEKAPSYRLVCEDPIIITDNDEPPDTDDLWDAYKHNRGSISCPMTSGMTCTKSTIYKNEEAQVIIYGCGIDHNEKLDKETGCYKGNFGAGAVAEVCPCDSEVGKTPCNYAFSILKAGECKWSAMLTCLIVTNVLYRIFIII